MRLKLTAILLFALGTVAFAQQKKGSLTIRSWTVSPKLGEIIPTNVDTILLDFQHYDTGDGYRSPRGYLGNLGSPSYSRVYFEREETPPFIFAQVYEPFLLTTSKAKFYNTTIPLTNLTYLFGGAKKVAEERFKAQFNANSGKRFNIGADFDNINARGQYAVQGVENVSYRLFASYIADRYSLHTFVGNSNHSNQENGGISDDNYITHPSLVSDSRKTTSPFNIPVNLDKAWNRVNSGVFFLTHRYNLGFYKTQKIDTTEIKTFVPVSSIIHSFEYNNIDHRFISKSNLTEFFDHNYLDKTLTNDSSSYRSIRNTVALSLREGFNKFAVFGLTAYLTNEFSSYSVMDTLQTQYSNQNLIWGTSPKQIEIRARKNAIHNFQSTFVGGELSRRMGKTINYKANGELCLLGERLGQMTLSGELETRIHIFKKEVQFKANGFIKNLHPEFYLNTYHSNHFWWNNSFAKIRKVRVEGEISVPEEHFSLKAGVENVQNYIYFNDKALPTQTSDNIQILSGCLSKDFKWGVFHFDNQIYGQVSSDQKIIPLPAISLYHNLYTITKLAKVLTFQIGVDVRYFTSYYGLAYQPAINQFHTQSEIKIGNYPLVCAYANMHLKRTRFYLMYYHADQDMVTPNYFSTPHYPVNPRFLKMGISWNFND